MSRPSLSELGKAYSKSFPANSILITIAAVIGATAITKEETWCPDSVVGIIPDTKQVDVRFLEYQLRALRPRLDGIEATQTAQKNINLQVLRPLPILLPSPEKQKEIVEQMQAIESQLEKLRRRGAGAASLISNVISEMEQA